MVISATLRKYLIPGWGGVVGGVSDPQNLQAENTLSRGGVGWSVGCLTLKIVKSRVLFEDKIKHF